MDFQKATTDYLKYLFFVVFIGIRHMKSITIKEYLVVGTSYLSVNKIIVKFTFTDVSSEIVHIVSDLFKIPTSKV